MPPDPTKHTKPTKPTLQRNEYLETVQLLFPRCWQHYKTVMQSMWRDQNTTLNVGEVNLKDSRSAEISDSPVSTEELLSNRAHVLYFLVGELMRCNGDVDTEDYSDLVEVLKHNRNPTTQLTKRLCAYAHSCIKVSLLNMHI